MGREQVTLRETQRTAYEDVFRMNYVILDYYSYTKLRIGDLPEHVSAQERRWGLSVFPVDVVVTK